MPAVRRSRASEGSSKILAQLLVMASAGPVACAKRLANEAKDPSGHAVGQISDNSGEPRLDSVKASLQAPGDKRKVRRLLPLILEALKHGGKQIKLGEDVAEPRGDHLLALQRPAERQERHVRDGCKACDIERKLPVKPGRGALPGRGRKPSAAPIADEGLRQSLEAVASMAPEDLIERF